jgi:hypothetical protein
MARQTPRLVARACFLAVACSLLCSCSEDTNQATKEEPDPEPPKVSKPRAEPLQVTVRVIEDRWPGVGWTRLDSLECRVRNITPVKQEFWLWSCSRDWNWVTDNKEVSFNGDTCRTNSLRPEFLAPGQTLVENLSVWISPKAGNKPITFRVAFVPYDPTKGEVDGHYMPDLERFRHALRGQFWSDKITVAPKTGKVPGKGTDASGGASGPP